MEDPLAGFPIGHPSVPDTPEWIIEQLEILIERDRCHYDWHIMVLLEDIQADLNNYYESFVPV